MSFLLLPTLLLHPALMAPAEPVSVSIRADRETVGMGRCVTLTATARLANGSPAAGWELLPYVDGKRWGAHHYADANGRSVMQIPLPTPGLRELEVTAGPPPAAFADTWIWARDVADKQRVYLQKTFELSSVPESAELWFVVDDYGEAYVNGTRVHAFGGWHNAGPVPLDSAVLRAGTNVLSVTADNGSGPAGLLLRLVCRAKDGGETVVLSGADWRAFTEQPAGWPATAADGGARARAFGTVNSGTVAPDHWPVGGLGRLLAGTLMPEGASRSNRVVIRVERRALAAMPFDPDHQVVVQWEPWFTPMNVFWQTAEAVPLMGYYVSYDEQATRQHVIWLIESGADSFLADWSNHIWQSPTWESRGPNCDEIIHATTLSLETFAKMRDEGLPVPTMTLLIGVSWTEKGEVAVNGQLDWIYENYIRNPRFQGLWTQHEGKPLILVLDLPGAYLAQERVLDPEGRFTIRYTSSQLDKNRMQDKGFWSWMDTGVPPITYKDGVAEAVTVAFGYFSSGGWTKEGSAGLRGGATILETMEPALREHPQVVFLHQFNEFAGQPEGQGHGPNHDTYLDTYNAELTDDFEPTSLDTPAYRSQGGWGFHYLNVCRALVDLYKQPVPETTVLVAESPRYGQKVTGETLELKWLTTGVAPTTFTIEVDGREVLTGLTGNTAKLPLAGLGLGTHTVSIVAPGTKSRYLLSSTEDSLPLAKPVPARIDIPVVVE